MFHNVFTVTECNTFWKFPSYTYSNISMSDSMRMRGSFHLFNKPAGTRF